MNIKPKFKRTLEKVLFSGEPVDKVIQVLLPDGHHWFKGVKLIPTSKDGSKPPIHMNAWEPDFSQLKAHAGVWTQSDADKWLKFVDLDGAEIRNYKDVLEQWNNLQETPASEN